VGCCGMTVCRWVWLCVYVCVCLCGCVYLFRGQEIGCSLAEVVVGVLWHNGMQEGVAVCVRVYQCIFVCVYESVYLYVKSGSAVA